MKNAIGTGEKVSRDLKRQVVGPRAHIDKGFDAFYKSAAWKAFRVLIKAERGERCEDKEHDDSKPRDVPCELDHIKELADGGEPLSRSNVLFRCRSCHVRKTNQLKRDRAWVEHWARVDRGRSGG